MWVKSDCHWPQGQFSPMANRSLSAKNDCCLPHADSPSNYKIVLYGFRKTTNYAVKHPYTPRLLLRCFSAEGRGKKPTSQQTKNTNTGNPLLVPKRLGVKAKYGLPSADRNTKATLLLTRPFRPAKSSAGDLIPLVLKLQYTQYTQNTYRGLAAVA
ncbi:hypothetical protein ACQKWADRAFT_247155 [Trichoderma austrokoningii]